jgi:hypothetical protein
LWDRVEAKQGRTRYISCDVLHADPTGWGYRSMLEHDEPEHFSCPPSYLRESPTLSQSWRDQVHGYWSQRHALRTDFSKLATDRALAQRFNEGDRIRYVGPATSHLQRGATGTIVRGESPFGPSIHADELCNSVFVKWDGAPAGTVFSARVEHEAAGVPQSLDEAASVQ